MHSLGAWVSLVVLGLVLGFSVTARAEITNYNRVHVGARATLMGGAATALPGDSAGAFNNPASYGWTESHGLSLSVSAYGIDYLSVPDHIIEDGREVPLTQRSYVIFPAATSYVVPLSTGEYSHVAALSLLVPTFNEYEGVRRLGARADLALDSTQEDVLLVGPSYSFRAGAISIGASAFLRVYSLNAKFAASVQDERLDLDGSFYNAQEFWFFEGTEVGLLGKLGIMYSTPRLSAGLVMTTPRVTMSDGADALIISSLTEQFDGDSPLEHYQDAYEVAGRIREDPPIHFGAGVMYETLAHSRLALDVDLYLPVSPYPVFRPDAPVAVPNDTPASAVGLLDEERGFPGEEAFVDQGRKLTVNVSLGGEYRLGDTYGLLGGIFTDFSALDGLPIGETVQGYLTRTDMVGLSLGLSRRSGDGELLIGVQGAFGRGEAPAIDYDTGTEFVADVTRYTALLTFGGSAALLKDD